MLRWSRPGSRSSARVALAALALLAAVLAPASAIAADDPPVGVSDLADLNGQWNGEYRGGQPDPEPDSYVDPDTEGQTSVYLQQTPATRDQGTTTLRSFPLPYALVGGGGQQEWVWGRATYVDGNELLGVIISPSEASSFLVLSLPTLIGTSSSGRFQGEYVTCGSAAFRSNLANPADGNLQYREGLIEIARGSATAVRPSPAPPEDFGVLGTVGGESPLCDLARQHPALFDTNAPETGEDQRRPSRTTVSCNRGPASGDPFACTATVGDASANPGASAPTGTVDLTASAPGLATTSCQLAPGSGATSTCSFTYANAQIGIGQAVPVTASYRGSAIHRPSSGAPQPVLPEPPTTGGGGSEPPVVCGPAPLPACEGRVPQPDPIQTCVANVPGACEHPALRPGPLEICVGNAIGACNGFAAGATLAGVLDETATTTTVTVACPGGTTALGRAATRATGDAAGQGGAGGAAGATCATRVVLSTEEGALVDAYFRALTEQVQILYLVHRTLQRQPAAVRRHLDRFAVEELLSPALRAKARDFNARRSRYNAAYDAQVTNAVAQRLRIDALQAIRLEERADRFTPYVVDDFGQRFADRRYLQEIAKKAAPAGAHARRKRAPLRTPASARKAAMARATGTRRAGAATATVPAGARRSVRVTLTRAARRLARARYATRRRTLPLVASITMTSSTGAFAPTTVQRTTTLRLKAAKKKPKPKGKGKGGKKLAG